MNNESTAVKTAFKILARHKDWVAGAMITESTRRDGATIDGVAIGRFTATVRGWRNWKIYEGPLGDSVPQFVADTVRAIRDRIDNGDRAVFEEPNIFTTEPPPRTIMIRR